MQVYFNNRSGQALDSLFEEYKIIKGARLSKNGRVLKPGRQEFDVTLRKESIESLFNYDHLLMKARIFVIGEDLDTVRFYSDYEVKFKMAMRVKLNVHPSELNN
jgi:hypothetical protein